MEELSATERINQLQPREIIRNPESIVVVTAIFYPRWYEGEPRKPLTADKVRGDLTIKTLVAARNQGFQLALVDGGSSEEFRKTLNGLGITFQMQREKGPAGPARRQALEFAQNLRGARVLCQTEPEKVSVIFDCLGLASIPILEDEADIVIPRRDEASFSTYPEYQAKSEKRANRLYNKILRAHGLLGKNDPDLDFWFGLRVFANKPEVVKLFREQYEFRRTPTALHKIVKPDAYSNVIFFPIVAALDKGLRVKTVEVPYRHPPEQTEFEKENLEFNRKRDIQRRAIVTELVHFIKFLEGDEKTRILQS